MHESVKLGGNPLRNMWTQQAFDGRDVYRSSWQWSID
jgi:hypothetical protein